MFKIKPAIKKEKSIIIEPTTIFDFLKAQNTQNLPVQKHAEPVPEKKPFLDTLNTLAEPDSGITKDRIVYDHDLGKWILVQEKIG